MVDDFVIISGTNIAPTALNNDIQEYLCESENPPIHDIPQNLDAASVCVILVSNMYMSVNQVRYKGPLVIELGNAIKVNKQAICIAVFKALG